MPRPTDSLAGCILSASWRNRPREVRGIVDCGCNGYLRNPRICCSRVRVHSNLNALVRRVSGRQVTFEKNPFFLSTPLLGCEWLRVVKEAENNAISVMARGERRLRNFSKKCILNENSGDHGMKKRERRLFAGNKLRGKLFSSKKVNSGF